MLIHYLLSQNETKKGIKPFCERCVREVHMELENLHGRKVIKLRLPIYMTAEQKIRSLSYLMFLKEKIYGSIKGRGCAYCSSQLLWMKKRRHNIPNGINKGPAVTMYD